MLLGHNCIDPNSYLKTFSHPHLLPSAPLPRRLSTRAISKINCLVLGETQQRIFPVKIDATENVGTLKQLIKEEEKHDLDYALR